MTGLGWDYSAPAWIASMGDQGGSTRQYMRDAPMQAALIAVGCVLDIGCGEGRFCRLIEAEGLSAFGLDCTEPLLAPARARKPNGVHLRVDAADLPFEGTGFEGGVFDPPVTGSPDFRRAISEAVRAPWPDCNLVRPR